MSAGSIAAPIAPFGGRAWATGACASATPATPSAANRLAATIVAFLMRLSPGSVWRQHSGFSPAGADVFLTPGPCAAQRRGIE